MSGFWHGRDVGRRLLFGRDEGTTGHAADMVASTRLTLSDMRGSGLLRRKIVPVNHFTGSQTPAAAAREFLFSGFVVVAAFRST